ncbi:hypothetical protein B0H19DRAFT_1208091 [Mycena capillaripes]|nr:hypothetical protein B0H19DRAFT_1208091 [Mycena capillaripes]
MFTGGKSVLACASILLALAAQTSAHAMPSVALGVTGAPQRSDVQRPSTNAPCGNIDPTTTLDTSTAIAAAADGSITMKVQVCKNCEYGTTITRLTNLSRVQNFNAGADGSTSVSVSVDQTGTGKSFVAGTVTTNGNPAPKAVETDTVVFTLPPGTQCAGGAAKNRCLVSVKTTAGFGACTVVTQAAGAAGAAAGTAAAGTAAAGTAAAGTAAAGTAAAGTAGTAAAGTAGTAATTGKKAGKKAGKKGTAAAKAAKAAAAKAAAAGAAGAAGAGAAAAPPAAPAAGAAAPPAAAAAIKVPKNKKVGTRAPRALRRELLE